LEGDLKAKQAQVEEGERTARELREKAAQVEKAREADGVRLRGLEVQNDSFQKQTVEWQEQRASFQQQVSS
jgi:hypothetical protein